MGRTLQNATLVTTTVSFVFASFEWYCLASDGHAMISGKAQDLDDSSEYWLREAVVLGMTSRLRRWGRRKYDALFCEDWPDIEKIGVASSWHVKTGQLNRNSVVYSAGVGLDVSFEKELIRRFEVDVQLFDPTPTGVATMRRPENGLPQLHFHCVGLAGSRIEAARFALPKDPREGSFTVAGTDGDSVEFQCKDLRSLMAERGHRRIDLLKMDIEGFEYGVVDDIVSYSIDVTQICVEFHHFLDHVPRRMTSSAVRRLRSAGYSLIYKSQCDYTFFRI